MKTVQVTDKFKIYVSNEIEQWRADTFNTKEPETIEWINSFKPDATFFDVGANIGIYSLYCASLFPDIQIYAFEPMKINYIRLMMNIELNDFKNIIALPFGVGNENTINYLTLTGSSVGESGSQINKQGDYQIPIITIDCLSEYYRYVDYIKIDIDGQEWGVLKGSWQTLSDEYQWPQSILVEVNQDRDKIIKLLDLCDYTTDNRFNKLKNHSRVRRAKEGIKAENVIFCRR